MPLVSVVMPVYNCEKFLSFAIDSILGQTLRDFEFIIINDGSSDSSENIMSAYVDSRIKLIRNETNLGITRSLNRGIHAATGKYICRMDADDVSMPERLELQVKFMEDNEDIALAGSNAILINSDGVKVSEERYPGSAREIKKTIFVHNPFAHGTIMLRTSVMNECGEYDSRFLHNEDYDLWLRIAARYPLANLQEFLLQRRIHESNITVTRKTELIRFRIRTLLNAVFHYYRKPAYAVYLVRPMAAYLCGCVRTLWK